MNTVLLSMALLTVMCSVHQITAVPAGESYRSYFSGYDVEPEDEMVILEPVIEEDTSPIVTEPVIDEVVEVEVGEVPPEVVLSNYGWTYPRKSTYPTRYGWALSNSEVLTGGSTSAKGSVLAGGSISADGGIFTHTKTNSRSRQGTNVSLGMIGGDGGDSHNSHISGIEYNGGGMVNFFSKVQGQNNQGLGGSDDSKKYVRGGYTTKLTSDYKPASYKTASYSSYKPAASYGGGYITSTV